MKKTALILMSILAFLPVFGLSPEAPSKSMDDILFESLRGHASFNAVLIVVFIILGGVLFYLWNLDRKVSKMLKEVEK